MTSKENVEAEKLLAEGKTDAALSKISRSLSKNPMQPDAIKIREQITGQPGNWPSCSMLEDIISDVSKNKAGKASSLAAPVNTTATPVASLQQTPAPASASVPAPTHAAIRNTQVEQFQAQAAEAALVQGQFNDQQTAGLTAPVVSHEPVASGSRSQR